MRRALAYPPLIALAAVLSTARAAQSRDLTAADLSRIEAINQRQNEMKISIWTRHDDPLCSIYAVNKAFKLGLEGYGPGEVRIAIVRDELGQLHAVAEVVGQLKGKPAVIVLDSRFTWTQDRKTLEDFGYTWLQEFSR